MSGMRRRVIHGIGWRGAADAGQMLLQIGFTAILARLLGVADFGLVAMCFLFLRFVRSLTDVGFGTAVIQSQTITEGQVSAVFVLQVLIKFGVCLICVFAAPLAAAFFEEPRLADLIPVLAWVIVADSLAFPDVILRKRLEFRGYSAVELSAAMIGGATGVAMALAGYGVWSLIARTLADKVSYVAGIWAVARWRPKRPDFHGITALVRFGGTMFASSTVHFWSQNLAAIILGKFLGAETLGLFNVAYNLAIVPAQKVQSVLTTVLTSAYSMAQATVSRLRQHVYASLFSVGAVFVPMMLGMMAVGPNLIVVVYGQKWAAAGFMLSGLALVGLLKGFEHIIRSVLIATGTPGAILKILLVETAVATILLPAGTLWLGVSGTICAYLATSALAFVLTVSAGQRRLSDPGLFFRATWRSFAASVVMVAAVVAWAEIAEASVAIVLLSQVLLGIAVYLLVRAWLLDSEERLIVRQWPVIGRIVKNA